MTKLGDIVFETDRYWVKRVPKGYEVYKTGLTHSTRVAVIGYTGDKGLERAKQEIARREAAGHATKRKSPRSKAAPPAPFPLGPPRSKAATVIVYSRPSGYWYAQARDATTGAPITDATGYSRDDVLRSLRGKFVMSGVAIESIVDEDPYAERHHATKKSAAELDREIAEALGRFPHDDPELRAKWRIEPSELRVGQRFDYFGRPFEIVKIGRDKAKTIQIASRYTTPSGREEFFDHRSFPLRAFYQQHLRPLRD